MTIHEIRLRKQELGYTNAQLAQLSGVPLGTVMKVLSGATKSPRRETLLALEKALSPYRHPSQGAGYDTLLPDHPAYDHGAHAGAANAALVRESSMKYNTSPRTKREYTEHGVSVDSAQNAAKYGSSPDTAQIAADHGTSPLTRQSSQKRLYTVDDYYALPDEIRTELIDGVFYDMASPAVTHQLVIGEMHIQFKECEKKHQGRCRVILSPCDVQLDKDKYTMLQPDLLIVCDVEKIKGRCCFGAPDLTVEVLSSANASHDCILKLRKYQQSGVREYWIVDPASRMVVVYRFDDPKDSPYQTYSFDDTIPIGISGGDCSIDFKVISDSLKFLE